MSLARDLKHGQQAIPKQPQQRANIFRTPGAPTTETFASSTIKNSQKSDWRLKSLSDCYVQARWMTQRATRFSQV